MEASLDYLRAVSEKLRLVAETQAGTIDAVADRVLTAFTEGGYLYLFGTGHSHMMAEELFYRAGGLARVKPILEEKLMLHMDASGSSALEREPGLGTRLAKEYGVTGRDVVIIASNSGRNTVAIDLALACREKGACVAALTSLAHTQSVKSRHAGGKRLFEVCDYILDNQADPGDACLPIGSSRVGAVSTVTGAATLQAMAAQITARAQERQIRLDVFLSSNVNGGDEHNKKILEQYRGIIRSL